MPQKQIFLTPEGLAKLEAELEYLRTVRRPEVADQINRAKGLGGTITDAEYDDAKKEQAFVEGRILTLEQMLKNAIIIESDGAPSDCVRIGGRVTVTSPDGEEERYIIVGSAETNPRDGKISNESPVGRALLGRRIGDDIQVMVPGGLLKLKIVSIG